LRDRTVNIFIARVNIQGESKSNTAKAINNILAYAKPFWAKFCPLIGNLYPHVCTKFGEFALKFNELGVHFSRLRK